MAVEEEVEWALDDARSYAAHLVPYAKAVVRLLVISIAAGVPCGLLGSAFHIGVDFATRFRLEHPAIIYALPVAGLIAVAIYHFLGVEGLSTNSVLEQIRTGEGLRLKLLPAVFLTTVLTHLFGGSAGREGAALQMGGTVGLGVGRLFHLDERDQGTAVMAGMAAFFSALFGTPIAATIFAMAVVTVGALYHVAFVPCLVASLTAYAISLGFGIAPTRFAVSAPALDPLMLLRVALLAWLCAMLSTVFCVSLHDGERLAKRLLPNPWLRAAAGGAVLLALSLLVGTGDYNGAGTDVIVRAIEEGHALPAAFAWKMLFTVVTLSVGFKGGEVVPCFFVGATFGCVVGPLIGIPAGFAAAVGLISVFCGAINCPITSMVLAVEMFGAPGMTYYALCCGIAFVLSGYSGLYASQRILYDKLKARYIDVYANAYHEGGLSLHHDE
jgi:H+/Cl- antiporter ClcA